MDVPLPAWWNARPPIMRDVSAVVMSQLAAAFAIESGFRPVKGPVVLVDERLAAVSVPAAEVPARLAATNALSGGDVPSARMVVAWEGLRHAFHPRAVLDGLCARVRPRGRLIYGQLMADHYVGVSPKWLLDYFVAAGWTDCRIYLLYGAGPVPAVATFDYEWMLSHARMEYNEMFQNITRADAVVVVAEKARDNWSIFRRFWRHERPPGPPSQDVYRPADEWARYAEALRRLLRSPRPWHLAGPAPAFVPAGCRSLPSPDKLS